VEGFSSGVNLGLVFKAANRNHPLVKEAKKLVQSDEWQSIFRTPDPVFLFRHKELHSTS
jgi:hypothetical protein